MAIILLNPMYLNPQELKEQDMELQSFVDSVNKKVEAVDKK